MNSEENCGKTSIKMINEDARGEKTMNAKTAIVGWSMEASIAMEAMKMVMIRMGTLRERLGDRTS
jgi:hypothetical protein